MSGLVLCQWAGLVQEAVHGAGYSSFLALSVPADTDLSC
jgi:hypothetical protein